LLSLQFGPKLNLPKRLAVRHCAQDNFLFLRDGTQKDYDEYYASVANDTTHQEVASTAARSRISQLQASHLIAALGDFFNTPRKVMDFGCGEASLLVELAILFPGSSFFGFDPGPAAATAIQKATALNLKNLSIRGLNEIQGAAPYDLVIMSHVMEHLIDFDLIGLLATLTRMLYVEVPYALGYATHQRREFLYYFDRLHVNHFTPQALCNLVTRYGFGYLSHFEYAFPYRDGLSDYPAFGMLFQKGAETRNVESPRLLAVAQRYIHQEQARARDVAGMIDSFDGVLVWGAGDNFYRSAGNSGPLSNTRKMILLDRRPQHIEIETGTFETLDPLQGLRQYPWPVIVTVSERRLEISSQIEKFDPDRRILFL
jgi:hypothetical protein